MEEQDESSTPPSAPISFGEWLVFICMLAILLCTAFLGFAMANGLVEFCQTIVKFWEPHQ